MWFVLQFAGIALLIALGLTWTRIPETDKGQVLLSLLIPLIIAALFLLLQAGTFRSLLRPLLGENTHETQWVSLAWGSVTLLIWIAIAWIAYALNDRFDNRTYAWASYLNSRFGAGARGRVATYPHILLFLSWLGTLLRWVVGPGLLVPMGSSTAWGLRNLPYRRIAHLWVNWRWWACVLITALVGGIWPRTWFAVVPSGSVDEQVRRVVAKLILAFGLALICWMATIVWAATLLTEYLPAKRHIRRADANLTLDKASDEVELPLNGSSEDPGGNA